MGQPQGLETRFKISVHLDIKTRAIDAEDTKRRGKEEEGQGLKSYRLNTMFPVWVMGSLEAQTSASHNILM